MVKWVTLWFNLGFSLKTLVAPLQPELFTVSVSWNDRTYCYSPWMGCQFIRGAPPLPHISSVFPDSSQVAINSPEWRGTGWEQSAFLKNITKRVRILTFRSRVQSPESGVRGPGSRIRSLESRYVTVDFIVKQMNAIEVKQTNKSLFDTINAYFGNRSYSKETWYL